MTAPTPPLRVLFVCTANISRSPYAEYRARQLLGDAPIVVSSAGIPGYPGRSLDPQMAVALQERGAPTEEHTSQALTAALLDSADLVLTFEFAQHMRVLDADPRAADKVFGLRQFAEALERLDDPSLRPDLVRDAARVAPFDSAAWDVDDPYRRGRGTARRTADQIDALLARTLLRLNGAAEN